MKNSNVTIEYDSEKLSAIKKVYGYATVEF